MKLLSHVQLFANPWTVAHQAPPSMEFSRQEYWSWLHFLLQGIFLTQRSNLGLPYCRSPICFTIWATREAPKGDRQASNDFEAVLFNPNSSILRLFGDCAWLLPLSVSNRAYMVGQNLTTKEELMVIHLPNHWFPSGSDGKASACNVGNLGSIPGSGRSPGEGNGNPLQYSCLENSMDGGAWWATVHGVAKSQTWLSNFTHSLRLVLCMYVSLCNVIFIFRTSQYLPINRMKTYGAIESTV